MEILFGYDKMGQIPFYTHKENTIFPVDILVEIKNITAIDIDKIGNDCHDTRLVGAMHQQDSIFIRFLYGLRHFWLQLIISVDKVNKITS